MRLGKDQPKMLQDTSNDSNKINCNALAARAFSTLSESVEITDTFSLLSSTIWDLKQYYDDVMSQRQRTLLSLQTPSTTPPTTF